MDRLSAAQRKKCMHNIRSKDTGIELALRRALWKKGYRYRKNYAALPGKPDIVFTRYKIAVFCDSEFFHGKDWAESLQAQIRRGRNSEFWEKKILGNMERDISVNRQLEQMGWTVIRFWGKDIRKSPEDCVQVIEECILERLLASADSDPPDVDVSRFLDGTSDPSPGAADPPAKN